MTLRSLHFLFIYASTISQYKRYLNAVIVETTAQLDYDDKIQLITERLYIFKITCSTFHEFLQDSFFLDYSIVIIVFIADK